MLYVENNVNVIVVFGEMEENKEEVKGKQGGGGVVVPVIMAFVG